MNFTGLKNAFSSMSLAQWGWLWVAYWRLLYVQCRLKFINGQAWLSSQIKYSRSNTAAERASEDGVGLHNADIQSIAKIEMMHESIRLAARLHVWPTACLPRSIVLSDMLNARGLKAQVCIGVSKSGNRLASHAWVELNGQMVMEPETVQQEFTPLEY